MAPQTIPRLLPLALIGAVLAGCTSDSSERTTGNRDCFLARNISSWAAQDNSTVNIRVNVRDFYQLSLLGQCPDINWVQGIGIQHRGSSWICSGLDATIISRGPGSITSRCPVRTVRRLSAEEVAALPPRARP
jgi:hypothetical protein